MINEHQRTTVTRRAVLGLLGTTLLPTRHLAASQAPGSDSTALVGGNNEFALDLYARLRGTQGNLFFSPYSISTSLAMTYVGARGATADQMAKVLRFALPPDRLHAAFSRLMRDLHGAEKKRVTELHAANALWCQQGYPFVPSFQRIARASYSAGVETVDFRRAPENARHTINAWIERQTQDKIRDLLPEGLLDQNTVAVLTNAIYFKAAWRERFAEQATEAGDFAVAATGAARKVRLMRHHGSYDYLDAGSFQVLDLPYADDELSMVVFLPRRPDGLPEFERTLTAGQVTEWLSRLGPHDVDVTLPRFKITASVELKPSLIQLGMPLAFSRERADFSGMAKDPRVFVSAVAHKAYVDVNEKGTEATAASGVVARAMSVRRQAAFRADRPFFFVIRDNRTGSILFAGRLVDPLG